MSEAFEAHRGHLRAVAYRMLGSVAEAEDAVQEAWLRFERADTSDVQNVRGWLTRVVSNVCLDMLRTRQTRGEEPLPDDLDEQLSVDGSDYADAVGPALLVVLDTLAPAERLAFVLHDVFDVSFDEIAAILGKSEMATRQLASRARRRVQGASPVADRRRQRELVDAFLAASRSGEFAGLLAVLDPNIELRVDAAAARMGATTASGAKAVAETFFQRAQGAKPAMVANAPGLAWSHNGAVRVAFAFTFDGDAITAIELIADPERIREVVGTVSS
ncbi:MAG TPA: sigma-70 family RNA polymerase sigma factor [Thermoanaerobaculia bacterium]|jgi:RNA polymerase sigma-70 factor (ECF subfamily)